MWIAENDSLGAGVDVLLIIIHPGCRVNMYKTQFLMCQALDNNTTMFCGLSPKLAVQQQPDHGQFVLVLIITKVQHRVQITACIQLGTRSFYRRET